MADHKRDALIFPVAAVVLVAWVAALGFGIVVSNFIPLSIVTPVMLMLAGYVFGVNLVRRSDGQ